MNPVSKITLSDGAQMILKQISQGIPVAGAPANLAYEIGTKATLDFFPLRVIGATARWGCLQGADTLLWRIREAFIFDIGSYVTEQALVH
jgi:hypothetical protein